MLTTMKLHVCYVVKIYKNKLKMLGGGGGLIAPGSAFVHWCYNLFKIYWYLVAPWQWTSYPSGRSAVVYCSAGAELGRSGYYLIAYDDSNDHRMLACFTPAGKGVCYSTNGNIRFFDDSLIFLKLDLTTSLQLI